RTRVIEAILVDHFWLDLELGQDESEGIACPPRRGAEHEIRLDPAFGHCFSHQRRVIDPAGGKRAVLIREGWGLPARLCVAQQTGGEPPPGLYGPGWAQAETLPASAAALNTARAFPTHSACSCSATESATMPAPACTYIVPSFTTDVLSTMQL